MFIRPSIPVLKDAPPDGDGWLHEVKFDGWRLQIHKYGHDVRFFSRIGADLSRIAGGLALSCKFLPDCIIDAELVAIGSDGKPSFKGLMFRKPQVMAWAFDLLFYAGADIRLSPIELRRAQLQAIVAPLEFIKFSESFEDPRALLEAAERMGMEGVVSKRAGRGYRSGTNPTWIKVKCPTWKAVNAERFAHLNKMR